MHRSNPACRIQGAGTCRKRFQSPSAHITIGSLRQRIPVGPCHVMAESVGNTSGHLHGVV